jgi:hypothetical protein
MHPIKFTAVHAAFAPSGRLKDVIIIDISGI